jgi:hypothetical protein
MWRHFPGWRGQSQTEAMQQAGQRGAGMVVY